MTSRSYWRRIARDVIEGAITEARVNGADMEQTIRAAYPFGQRANWPYQAWLAEVNQALVRLGLREAPAEKPQPPTATEQAIAHRAEQVRAGQRELF